jgi:hypothetical protein
MKNKITIIAVLLSVSIAMSSCGVMFGGSKYEATIVAKDHPNADIYVDGQKIGKGTASGRYKRDKSLTVELREDGYANTTQTFENRFRTGNFILSVVSWGLIGIVVDMGTGAAYKPDHKKNPAIEKVTDKEYIFTVLSTGAKS